MDKTSPQLHLELGSEWETDTSPFVATPESPLPFSVDDTIPRLSLLPSAEEYAGLAALIHDFAGPTLIASSRADIVRYIEHGCYASAVDAVCAAAEATPSDASLLRLSERLRSAAMTVVENRIGSVHRRVAPGPLAGPGASTSRIIDLAAGRPTILKLLRTVQGDPLWTLEQVVRLIRHHYLLLLCASSSGPPSR